MLLQSFNPICSVFHYSLVQRSQPSLYCSIGRPRDVKPAHDLSQPGAISLSRLFLCIHQHSTTKHWLKRFCRELLMQRNPEVVNTKSSFWYCHQTRVLKFYCWRWNISFNFLNFWGHARLEILTQAHNNAMLVLLIAEPSTSPTCVSSINVADFLSSGSI